MDINNINELLREGKTVKEIRELLGYSEKKFQKEIKNLGYKFDQRLKQYINNDIVKLSDSNSNTLCNTICNTAPSTEIINKSDKENLNFIGESIELLNEKLLYYICDNKNSL